MTILPSAYLAPVQYYTKLCGGESVIEDRGEHYVKQTCRNRCRILGARGVETLIIPIEHGGGTSHTPMRVIRISSHDPAWQRRHWHALRTAYDNTPYFLYFADTLAPIFERHYAFLCDWNAEVENAVCALFGLSRHKKISNEYVVATNADDDCRTSPLRSPSAVPYWQVHAPQGEFVPDLSIADLLFNMGPEARLVLSAQMAQESPKRTV